MRFRAACHALVIVLGVLVYPGPAWALDPVRVASPIQDRALEEGGPALSADLSGVFEDPALDQVRFSTVLGTFDVRLHTGQAPLTVANFLAYVASRRYEHSFFHRLVSVDGLRILQGGGFTFTAFEKPNPAKSDYVSVPKYPPVKNEFLLPNVRGTLAMAKVSGDPDSATSQWFFNMADNSATLGPANNGGFTVFGEVLPPGMDVLDSLFQAPVWNAAVINSAFGTLPLRNFANTAYPDETNLLMVDGIVLLPDDLSFSARSSDPGLVEARVEGRTLWISSPSGFGDATVTVAAEAPDGRVAETVFFVTVEKQADYDGDGETGLEDAVAVLRALAGLPPPGPDAARDMDADGKMSLTEALLILQVLAGTR